MKFKKMAAVSAALIIAGVGTAQADSIAKAVIDITNFKWMHKDENAAISNWDPTINPNGEVQIQAGGQNTAGMGVTLNGTGPSAVSDSPSILPPANGQIAFRSLCTGPSCGPTPPNPWTGDNLPNGKTYAYSDYSLAGAVIDVPQAVPPVIAGVVAHLGTQTSLAGGVSNPSVGTGSTNEGANSTFLVKAATTFTSYFILDYAVHLLANVVSPYGATDNAKASSTWSLIIRDVFNPTEEPLNFKPGDLNFDVAVNAGQPALAWDKTATSVKTADFTLHAGDTYLFTISSTVNSDAGRGVDVVPEPDSMALFGIGIVGLMAASLKRKKA